jgi:hypothetical protein
MGVAAVYKVFEQKNLWHGVVARGFFDGGQRWLPCLDQEDS